MLWVDGMLIVDGAQGFNTQFRARKIHWTGVHREIGLQVAPAGLAQVDLVTKKRVCFYDYKDIGRLRPSMDVPSGFILEDRHSERLHFFIVEQLDEMMRIMNDVSRSLLGIQLVMDVPITTEEFQERRIGKFRDDEDITSLAEFPVTKYTTRYPDPMGRIFCITESLLIERDPAT